MPNWCYNNMEVCGRPEDVRDFVEATKLRVKDDSYQRYDLNQIYPCPQELSDTVSGWSSDEAEQAQREIQYAQNTEKYGHKDWYDWANAVWGTKWGACDVELECYESGYNSVRYHYSSAWSPATGLIANISAKFPTLVFSTWFEEEGVAYMGGEVFHRGELVYEKWVEYDEMSLPDCNWEDDEEIDAYNDAKMAILDGIADDCDAASSGLFCEIIR